MHPTTKFVYAWYTEIVGSKSVVLVIITAILVAGCGSGSNNDAKEVTNGAQEVQLYKTACDLMNIGLFKTNPQNFMTTDDRDAFRNMAVSVPDNLYFQEIAVDAERMYIYNNARTNKTLTDAQMNDWYPTSNKLFWFCDNPTHQPRGESTTKPQPGFPNPGPKAKEDPTVNLEDSAGLAKYQACLDSTYGEFIEIYNYYELLNDDVRKACSGLKP